MCIKYSLSKWLPPLLFQNLAPVCHNFSPFTQPLGLSLLLKCQGLYLLKWSPGLSKTIILTMDFLFIYLFCNRQDLFRFLNFLFFFFFFGLYILFICHMRLKCSLSGRGLIYIFLNIEDNVCGNLS